MLAELRTRGNQDPRWDHVGRFGSWIAFCCHDHPVNTIELFIPDSPSAKTWLYAVPCTLDVLNLDPTGRFSRAEFPRRPHALIVIGRETKSTEIMTPKVMVGDEMDNISSFWGGFVEAQEGNIAAGRLWWEPEGNAGSQVLTGCDQWKVEADFSIGSIGRDIVHMQGGGNDMSAGQYGLFGDENPCSDCYAVTGEEADDGCFGMVLHMLLNGLRSCYSVGIGILPKLFHARSKLLNERLAIDSRGI